jgi:HEAT repeat protein
MKLNLILLTLLCMMTPALAQQATDETYAAAAKYKFGDSRKDLAAIEATIRSAKPDQYKAIESKLLPLIKSPDTAIDAKRYFLRYLQTVGAADSIPVAASFLADENLADPARIALQTMPNPAAGEALRKPLAQAAGGVYVGNGRTLAGLIGSISARRDVAAVPDLSKLTSNNDITVATAAVNALGHIGTPEAAAALSNISRDRTPANFGETITKAQLECATQLAADGHKAEALAIFQKHLDPNTPKGQRIAALKGTMGLLDRDESIKLIASSLQSGDPIMRIAALSSFTTSADPAFKASIVDQLPKMNPEAQLALLPILAQDATPAHATLLAILNQASNEAVRIAALDALPMHCEATDVSLLLSIALKANSESEKDAAKHALDRLGKPGVNDALIALLTSTDQGARQVAVNALADRHAAEAIAPLMKLASGNDPTAATDAIKSLEILGTINEAPGLVHIIATTNNDELRSTAEHTAGILINRGADRQAASDALQSALESAHSTPALTSLIHLLPRTRTTQSLATCKSFALSQAASTEPAVRDSALRALADWPDISAASPLLDIAKSSADNKQAIIAAQGALRVAGIKDAPIGARVDTYRALLDVAKRPEEKKQALAGLAELPTPAAIKTLKQYADDPALGADAKQALKRLGSAGMNPQGLILSWSLSGPYMQEGKDGAALFDVAFPPEKSTASGEWRLVTSPNGMIELDKLIGGNDRVAYLLVTLTSPADQDALLACGSDDGIKVFLNGKVVLAKNAARPAQADQDRATIHLKQGPNTLLLKITQGGGQWAGIARLRTPDNKPLDVSVTPGAD